LAAANVIALSASANSGFSVMRSPRHELGTTPTVYNWYKPHLGARGCDGGVR
jgi:hypothetical protein